MSATLTPLKPNTELEPEPNTELESEPASRCQACYVAYGAWVRTGSANPIQCPHSAAVEALTKSQCGLITPCRWCGEHLGVALNGWMGCAACASSGKPKCLVTVISTLPLGKS